MRDEPGPSRGDLPPLPLDQDALALDLPIDPPGDVEMFTIEANMPWDVTIERHRYVVRRRLRALDPEDNYELDEFDVEASLRHSMQPNGSPSEYEDEYEDYAGEDEDEDDYYDDDEDDYDDEHNDEDDEYEDENMEDVHREREGAESEERPHVEGLERPVAPRTSEEAS